MICSGAQADSPLSKRCTTKLQHTHPTIRRDRRRSDQRTTSPPVKRVTNGVKILTATCQIRGCIWGESTRPLVFPPQPSPRPDSFPPKEKPQVKTRMARSSFGLELVLVFDRGGISNPRGGQDFGKRPWRVETVSVSPTSARRAGAGGSGTACRRAGQPRLGPGSAPQALGRRSCHPGHCGTPAAWPSSTPRGPPEEAVTRR